MSCGYTVKVSTATYIKHWRIYAERTRTCIPYFIWSDGHTICNRWYWFKNEDRIGAGYCSAMKR